MINANRFKANPQKSEEILVEDDPMTRNVRWVLISCSGNLAEAMKSTQSQKKKIKRICEIYVLIISNLNFIN